jgi:hypothetical protein
VIHIKKIFYVVVKCDLLFEIHKKIFELDGNEIIENSGYYISRTSVVYAGHLVLRE